jgi:hypothetical protein
VVKLFLAKLRWQHNLSKSREFGGMGTRAEGKRAVEGKEGKKNLNKKEKKRKRKEFVE